MSEEVSRANCKTRRLVFVFSVMDSSKADCDSCANGAIEKYLQSDRQVINMTYWDLRLFRWHVMFPWTPLVVTDMNLQVLELVGWGDITVQPLRKKAAGSG
jgi:hypothetical protein